MALPISAGEIYGVAKFAYDLWKSCKAFDDDFEQIGKEIFAMRTVIELVHIECQNPESIINLVDNKEKTVRKQLGIYLGNCQQALKSVDRLLKRYKAMNLWDRIAWGLSGHAEISSLESDLSSFATQLDSYVQKIELKGLALVNKNIGLANRGIGRLEDLLEQHGGDEQAAVADFMQERQKSGVSQEDTRRSQTVMLDYAREVSKRGNNKQQQRRPTTPDPPRGRPPNSPALGVPKEGKRASSAQNASQAGGKTEHRPSKASRAKGPKCTLECWLIQRKSAQALFVTFELAEKESQCRGQWKLREMAMQFNSSCETDKLDSNHDLVNWVVKDRRKKEADGDFTWYPFAAKIERKGHVLMGMGIEEQAMVIIKRQLTPSAQKVADRKAAAKAKEADQKAKAQREAARRKAAEAALKEEKQGQAAKIKELEKENAKLKQREKGGKLSKQNEAKPKDAHKAASAVGSVNEPTKNSNGKGTTTENAQNPTPNADRKSPQPSKKAAKDQPDADRSQKKQHKSDNPKKALSTPAKKITPMDKAAGTSDLNPDSEARKDKSTKGNQKGRKAESANDGASSGPNSDEKKGRTAAEIQALKEENARLKAALQEAGSQV